MRRFASDVCAVLVPEALAYASIAFAESSRLDEASPTFCRFDVFDMSSTSHE